MNDEQPLEEQFRMLAKYVKPEHDLTARVMERVRRNAEKPGRVVYLDRVRRWIMQPVPRYAAGLTIVAVVSIALFIWLNPSHLPKVAFADVQEAIRQIETAVVTLESPAHPWHDHRAFYRRDLSVTRKEYSNEIILRDIEQAKTLILDPKNKLAQILPGSHYVGAPFGKPRGFPTPRAFLDELAGLEQEAVRPLGEQLFGGRRLVGFAMPLDQTDKNDHMVRKLWVDPETRLPVRYEYLPTVSGNLAADSRRFFVTFRFNEPIDDAVFDWNVPEDYTVLGPEVDRNWTYEIPPPPDTEAIRAMVVEPLVGVGPARFGMSVEEIIAVLGPPGYIDEHWEFTPEEYKQSEEIWAKVNDLDKDQSLDDVERSRRRREIQAQLFIYRRPHDGMHLQYHNLGIDMTVLNEGGLIWMTCNKQVPPWKDFWGKTTKGIGIGSTFEEIEKAYGPADVRRGDDDGSSTGILVYVSLAMQFQTEDGRLWWLMLAKDPKTGGYDKIKLDEKQ